MISIGSMSVDDGDVRVDAGGGVVHALLEGAVEVGEGLCAAGEAHVLAEVVAAGGAVAALAALDAGLDGDALADVEAAGAGRRRRGPNRGDHAGGLVPEHERGLERKVAVAAVEIVVHCSVRAGREHGGQVRRARSQWKRGLLTVAATETGRLDLDLDVALLWGPHGALLDAEVAGTVEDDGGLGAQHGGRHGSVRCGGGKRRRRGVRGGVRSQGVVVRRRDRLEGMLERERGAEGRGQRPGYILHAGTSLCAEAHCFLFTRLFLRFSFSVRAPGCRSRCTQAQGSLARPPPRSRG